MTSSLQHSWSKQALPLMATSSTTPGPHCLEETALEYAQVVDKECHDKAVASEDVLAEGEGVGVDKLEVERSGSDFGVGGRAEL